MYSLFKQYQYTVLLLSTIFVASVIKMKHKIRKKKCIVQTITKDHIAHYCTHWETPHKAVHCGSGIQPSSYSNCAGGYCPEPNVPEVKVIA